MNVAARIWLELGMDSWPAVRKLAALCVFDLIELQHETGYFEPLQSMADKLSRRWQLGDWRQALSAHYPVKG